MDRSDYVCCQGKAGDDTKALVESTSSGLPGNPSSPGHLSLPSCAAMGSQDDVEDELSLPSLWSEGVSPFQRALQPRAFGSGHEGHVLLGWRVHGL